MPFEVTIPNTITVHLGPPNSNARNVTVPFVDYIKNVASSEIYPTWPENALRANILAQISFALNRIYTEYYRTRGYNFDITNSPAYDQAFVYERNIFENISEIVDEIFNNYARREGEIIPLFTQYCDGRTVQCDGLSQWGTVTLANQGYTPLEILQYYYGDDVEIVQNAPIQNLTASYPGEPIQLGDSGKSVIDIQGALNRISKNYPSIKPIPIDTIGYFGVSTQDAVKEFQRIFNLTQDGIVGKATWYKIIYVYVAVKRLAELDSEGIQFENVEDVFRQTVRRGDTGNAVRAIQYYINMIALFNDEVQSTDMDGIFGPGTEQSVKSFQAAYGMSPNGVVDQAVWNKITSVYNSIVDKIPPSPENEYFRPFPGRDLIIGSQNSDVRLMQTYLNRIARVYKTIPTVEETGYYGAKTAQTVSAFQEEFGIPVSGSIGPVTWDAIVNTMADIA